MSRPNNTEREHTMKTNNAIARHIATKQVAKHMDRASALHLWNSLKDEGWTKDGAKLAKEEEAFAFIKAGNKVVVCFLAVKPVDLAARLNPLGSTNPEFLEGVAKQASHYEQFGCTELQMRTMLATADLSPA